MSGAGFPTMGGSGNGTPPRSNHVDTTYPLYRECRARLEIDYPRLRDEQFFSQLEAYMVVCEVESAAKLAESEAQLPDEPTWVMTTPDDFSPFLTIYFTYSSGRLVLRAVWD